MNLISIEQPFVFPGLNAKAIDFLLSSGKWLPYENGEGMAGLVVDRDRFDPDNKYKAIVGVYIEDQVLITRTHDVVRVGTDKVEMALYKYKLNDDSWVWESIDQVIADIKPILCLVDEYNNRAFEWDEDEIEEAILFMIENDLM